MILGLNHINIRTADIAGTKRFFVDALGMSEGWRPDVPIPGAWYYFEGRPLVHIVEVEEDPGPSDGCSLDHFAFSIADYEEMRRRLDEYGVSYREGALGKFGVRQLIVKDASGVTVELNWTDPDGPRAAAR